MKKILIMMIGAALVSVSCSPASKKVSNHQSRGVGQESTSQQRSALTKNNPKQQESTASSLQLSALQQSPAISSTSSSLQSHSAQPISASELNELSKLRSERDKHTQKVNNSIIELKNEYQKYQADIHNPDTVPDQLSLNRLITARDTAKQRLTDFNLMKGDRLQELANKQGASQEQGSLQLLDDVIIQAR